MAVHRRLADDENRYEVFYRMKGNYTGSKSFDDLQSAISFAIGKAGEDEMEGVFVKNTETGEDLYGNLVNYEYHDLLRLDRSASSEKKGQDEISKGEFYTRKIQRIGNEITQAMLTFRLRLDRLREQLIYWQLPTATVDQWIQWISRKASKGTVASVAIKAAGRFIIAFDDQRYQFDIHRVGCADLATSRRTFQKYTWKEVSNASTAEAAMNEALDGEFGSSTVSFGPRKGQEVNDATFREIGATARIMPCALEAPKVANGPVATVIIYGLDTEKERTSVHYDEGKYYVLLDVDGSSFEASDKTELMNKVAEFVEHKYQGFHVNFQWIE